MITRRELLQNSAWVLTGVFSATTISSLISSCKSADTSSDWKPMVFNQDQYHLAGDLAEVIIPKTDTPGAKDALVHRVIDEALKYNFTAEDRQKFLDGLAAIDARSKDMVGKNFALASEGQKNEVVKAMAKEAQGQSPDEQKGNVFVQFRQLVIYAYVTSEVACKEFFTEDGVPGKYISCMDYPGKMWAPV